MRTCLTIFALAACAPAPRSDFHSVEVRGPLHVTIRAGEHAGVTAPGVSFSNTDGVLRLEGRAPLDVDVTTPASVGVLADDGAQVALPELVSAHLNVTADHGARIAGTVDADTVVIHLGADAQASLAGRTRVLEVFTTGTRCSVDAARVEARVVRLQTTCPVEVRAREVVRGAVSAQALVAGGARLEVSASPGLLRRVEARSRVDALR